MTINDAEGLPLWPSIVPFSPHSLWFLLLFLLLMPLVPVPLLVVSGLPPVGLSILTFPCNTPPVPVQRRSFPLSDLFPFVPPILFHLRICLQSRLPTFLLLCLSFLLAFLLLLNPPPSPTMHLICPPLPLLNALPLLCLPPSGSSSTSGPCFRKIP